MKNKIQLLYAESEDWIGVYVDGNLQYEGRGIQENELLTILKIPYEEKYIDFEDMGWNKYPEKFPEIVEKMETLEEKIDRLQRENNNFKILAHEFIELGGSQDLLDKLGLSQ